MNFSKTMGTASYYKTVNYHICIEDKAKILKQITDTFRLTLDV